MKKLSHAAALQQDPGAKKRKPQAPDLGDTVAPKKKAKAQAKKKAAAKPIPDSKKVLQPGENAATLQQDITAAELAQSEVGSWFGDARQRLWLDDVLSAVVNTISATGHAKLASSPSNVSDLPVVPYVIGLALEFAIVGKVYLNKRVINQWSKLRPTLQSMIVTYLDKMHAVIPKGQDVEAVLHKLLVDASQNRVADLMASNGIQKDAHGSASGLARSVLGSKTALTATEAWLKTNNDKDFRKHASFSAYMSLCKSICCTCGGADAWDEPVCDFHDKSSFTLQDLLFGLAKAVDDDSMARQVAGPPAIITVVGSSALIVGADMEKESKRLANLSKTEAATTKEGAEIESITGTFGKDCKFLVSETSKDDKAKEKFSEGVIALLMVGRVRYLLAAAAIMMKRPHYGPKEDRSTAASSGAAKGTHAHLKYIRFDDIGDLEAALLCQILQLLTSVSTSSKNEHEQTAAKFVLSLEARFAFQTPSDASGDVQDVAWSTMWASTLTHVLKKAKKACPKQEYCAEDFDLSAKLVEWLPLVSAMCPKSIIPDATANAKNVKTESEDAAASSAKPSAEGQSHSTLTTATPSLMQILNMHGIEEAKGSDINVLDVLAIKAAVQVHLLSNAA